MEHTTAATAVSKTAHTPGPWTLNTQYADIEVRGPEGSGVMIAAMSPWGIAADRPDPQRANARLIAAAPDMLIALREAEAALEVAVGRLLKRQPDYPVHVTSEHLGLVLVRSAIAQATGSAA